MVLCSQETIKNAPLLVKRGLITGEAASCSVPIVVLGGEAQTGKRSVCDFGKLDVGRDGRLTSRPPGKL